MSQASGFILAAAQVGLEAVMIKPKRGMFTQGNSPYLQDPIIAQATVEEVEHDEMEIVEHPVEVGASISDHAFKRPSEVMIRYAFSNSPSAAGLLQGLAAAAGGAANIPQSLMAGNAQAQCTALYERLLAIQANRVLFTLYTGKRKHVNMLIKMITNPTDKRTENALELTIMCRQILFAVTSVVTLGQTSADVQQQPDKTSPVTDRGDVSLTQAPTVQTAVNAVTGPVNNTISAIATGAAVSPEALSAAVTSGVTALNNAAAIATGTLPGIMDTLANAAIDGANSLSSALAGAAGQLPGIANEVSANLTAALSTVGTPFEIPLLTSPQTLSITIGAQVNP